MNREEMEEIKRYFGVVAEGLERKVQQVAEGHQILMNGQSRIMDRIDRLERELGAMIKFSYSELECRMTALEGEVTI